MTDGPSTQTKERLLGPYGIDCTDCGAAIATTRDLRAVNPSAIKKYAPSRFIPGVPFPGIEASQRKEAAAIISDLLHARVFSSRRLEQEVRDILRDSG